jgi:hypothetical protein
LDRQQFKVYQNWLDNYFISIVLISVSIGLDYCWRALNVITGEIINITARTEMRIFLVIVNLFIL